MKKYQIDFIKTIFKENQILIDKNSVEKYSYDHTENLVFFPFLVVLPENSDQICKLVSYCNQEKIPITPRGAGTGLMGGALAINGGIIISLEKMNKIINIDLENHQVIVEPGVINFHLQEALSEHNLFFPPDPSSWGSCFIGGNIATNAGGPKAVKYGVTSAYILNLQVVLPNGNLIWTGANTLKNSTGLNLTQLFVGSEGTLGIITKAVLKVIPKPKEDITILIPFYDLYDSAKAVNVILQNNLNPCSLELMEKNALEQAITFIDDSIFELNTETKAHLLVTFDGNDKDEIIKTIEKTLICIEHFKIGEIFLADNESEKNKIWMLRRKVAEIVKSNGYTIEEDVVVPRSKLPDLINFVHNLSEKHNFKVVCYGHAGDGNLHVRINHSEHKNSYESKEIEPIIRELFEFVCLIGGTISGEHGIGLIQKKYMNIAFSNHNLELQKSIKLAFDPNHIMNPNKVYLSL